MTPQQPNAVSPYLGSLGGNRDVGFDPGWLAARRRYDDAALYPPAIEAIQTWAATLPADRAPVVVDLGSGTGSALARARSWLTPRSPVAYAVDRDADLLALAAASSAPANAPSVTLLADILAPLDHLGGPADGSVDLVVGHALSDLLPLDRLVARSAALVRPGGLVHLALAYDGVTEFAPQLPGELASLEARLLEQFHLHMDRPRAVCPTYGGSTSGRRLPAALTAAGLEIVTSGPSHWFVSAADGPDGQRVLAWLLRFIAEATTDLGQISASDLDRWLQVRQSALAIGALTARVAHQDALARRP